MPSARVTDGLVSEAAARRARHQQLFEAIASLGRTIEEIWLANKGRIRVHGPAQRVLAVLSGKATKTLDAIRILCESGFGQDAVILTRSLVNLVINVWYIGPASNPDEQALDYNASGWKAWHKFLRDFPGRRDPPPELPNFAEIEERAKRWDDVSIFEKASGSDLQETYREVSATGRALITPTRGVRVAISLVPTVSRSRSATLPAMTSSSSLGYAFQGMLIFMHVFCNAFRLAEHDRLEALRAEFLRIGTRSPDPA